MISLLLGCYLSVHQPATSLLSVPKAEAAETTELAWTPSSIEELAKQIAQRKGIPEYLFVETMRRESAGFTVIGQSTVPNAEGPNEREDSWGICQIHLPDHLEITKEQAEDPSWCLNWSADEFKAGHARNWTEYRKLTKIH